MKEVLASEKSIISHVFSFSFLVRCLPITPYVYNILFGRAPPVSLLSPVESSKVPSESKGTVCDEEKDKVIIVGGGIAGLTLAVCLHKLDIPFILIEKKSKNDQEEGADLGLWPSSIKILKEMGISEEFWRTSSYKVAQVYMSKLGKDQDGTEKSLEDILKIVNMESVVEETGEDFRLVSRKPLMDSLNHQLAHCSSSILYSTSITQIDQYHDHASVQIRQSNGTNREIKGRIIIGADGINSLCREYIISSLEENEQSNPRNEQIRYSGEVCYRGVIDLKEQPKSQVTSLLLENEKQKPKTMTIYYGDGIRASWGLINEASTLAYWWIKVKSPSTDDNQQDTTGTPSSVTKATTIKPFPHPLQAFYDATPKSQLYIHPVIDRAPIDRWCSERVVLVGDAAHPVTPNMAQGKLLYLLSFQLSSNFLPSLRSQYGY
jgi:2-polyprenyl-6-methoxyphenol hydroxylase-like FAD-dependent oxidoreductase